MTHAERILDFLRRHAGTWFDDDELSRHLAIRPRRAVNQVCNRLYRQGLIRRERVDGKLHNRWPPAVAAAGDPTPSTTPPKPAVTGTVRPEAGQGATADLPEEEWWWEGNVQAALVRHLQQQGWTILQAADTRSRERGTDIVAERDGWRLAIEVKRYPSRQYVRGSRHGKPKPTQPTLQARHWLAEAVLKTLLSGSGDPGRVLRAIALPDVERYRSLLQQMDWALTALGIGVFFVHQDGRVGVWREPRPFRAG